MDYPVKEEIPPLTESEKKILDDWVLALMADNPGVVFTYSQTPRGILLEIVPPKSVKIGHRGSGV